MPKMLLAPQLTTATVIKGRMELARFMEMPEGELEDLARRLEASPLVERLTAAGVLTLAEFPTARFAARRFAGYGLRMSGSGLPELTDGNCDLVRLMQGIGQQSFEKWFLGEASFSDEERARECGISVSEARMLREFADRAFIQGEFEGPAAPAPEKVFSAVAGIEIEGEKPVLSFFHREVWKRRYRVNQERLAGYLAALPQAEAGKLKNFLSRLEIIEKRKTTLYRLLEEVLRGQSEYLRTGDPANRQPLTQRAMAVALDVDPSVINRLISNKSVQMPWGLEAPLSVFFPSAKVINREKLHELVHTNPGWGDDALRGEMGRRHGVILSRRSISQYRQELTLGGRHRREVPAAGHYRGLAFYANASCTLSSKTLAVKGFCRKRFSGRARMSRISGLSA